MRQAGREDKAKVTWSDAGTKKIVSHCISVR